MELKLYCIVSAAALSAMGGNRGKLAAQAGHAYLHSYWDSLARFPKEAWAYEDSLSAVKICLLAADENELRSLEKNYKPKCGVSLVTDSARTVFSGPTVTCLGLGPIAPEDIGPDLAALPLLI